MPMSSTGLLLPAAARIAGAAATEEGWRSHPLLVIGLLVLAGATAVGAVYVVRRLRTAARINAALRLQGPLTGRLLEASLRELSGDPSLQVFYSVGEQATGSDGVEQRHGSHYVDSAGDDREPPRGTDIDVVRVGTFGGIVVTVRQSRGRRRSLRDAVVRAASPALEKARSDIELRRALDEVRSSRERLMRRSIDERNQLQGRLHDHAQSALTVARLQIGEARAELADHTEAAGYVDEADRHLNDAVRALREIVGEIYAPQLRRGQLAPALNAAMLDFPIAVTVHTGAGVDGVASFDQQTASACFFTITDALREIVREDARHAEVLLDRVGSDAVITVTYRRAPSAGGDEWTSVSDRVQALNGTMTIVPTDDQHVLELRLPCVS